MPSTNNASYWKISLTIISLFILTVRIIGCLNRDPENQPIETKYFNHVDTRPVEHYRQQRIFKSTLGISLLHKDYAALEATTPTELRTYQIKKITTDTLIVFDFTSKIKVNANTYYLKNYDDRLKLGLKAKDNITILIYDFESPQHGSIIDEFKLAKKNAKITNTKEEKLNTLKTISYDCTFGDIKYEGFALASKQDDRFLYFAFESSKLNRRQLQKAAVDFLTTHFKSTK